MDSRRLVEPSPGPGWTTLQDRSSRSPTALSFPESMDLDHEIDELRSTVAPNSQPESPPKGMSAVAAGKRKAPAPSASSSARPDKPNKVARTGARDHARDTDTDTGGNTSSSLDMTTSLTQVARTMGPSPSKQRRNGGFPGQTAVRGRKKNRVQVARKSTGGVAPRPFGALGGKDRRVSTQSLLTGANKPSAYIDDPLRPNHPKKKALRKSIAGYPNPSPSLTHPSSSHRAFDITLSSTSASASDDTDGPSIVRTKRRPGLAPTQPVSAPSSSFRTSTNEAGQEMIEILDSDEDVAATPSQAHGQAQGQGPSASAVQMPPPAVVPPRRRVTIGGARVSGGSGPRAAAGVKRASVGGVRVPASTATSSASSQAKTKAAPPPGAEVITIDDSDEDEDHDNEDRERGDVERSLDVDVAPAEDADFEFALGLDLFGGDEDEDGGAVGGGDGGEGGSRGREGGGEEDDDADAIAIAQEFLEEMQGHARARESDASSATGKGKEREEDVRMEEEEEEEDDAQAVPDVDDNVPQLVSEPERESSPVTAIGDGMRVSAASATTAASAPAPASAPARISAPAPAFASASTPSSPDPLSPARARAPAPAISAHTTTSSSFVPRWAPVQDEEAARLLYGEKEKEKGTEKATANANAQEEVQLRPCPLLQVRGSLYAESMVPARAAGGLKAASSTSSASSATASGSGSATAAGSKPVSAPGSTSEAPAKTPASAGRVPSGDSDFEMEGGDGDGGDVPQHEPQPDEWGSADDVDLEDLAKSLREYVPASPSPPAPASSPDAMNAQDEDPNEDKSSSIASASSSEVEPVHQPEPDSHSDFAMEEHMESPSSLSLPGIATLPENSSSAKAKAPVRPSLSVAPVKPASALASAGSPGPLSATGRAVVRPPRPLSFSKPSSGVGSPVVASQSQPVSQVQDKPTLSSRPVSQSKTKSSAFQPAPVSSDRGVFHRTSGSQSQPASTPAPASGVEHADVASMFNSIHKAQTQANALRASIASSATASSSSASASATRPPAASQHKPQGMHQMDLAAALNNVHKQYRIERTVDLTLLGSDSDASGSALGSRSSKGKGKAPAHMPPPATPVAHRRRSSGGITKKSASDAFKTMITPVAEGKRRVTLGHPASASAPASASLSPEMPATPGSGGSSTASGSKMQLSPSLARSRGPRSSSERFSAFIVPSPRRAQPSLKPPSSSSMASSSKKSVQFEPERVGETSSSESGGEKVAPPVFNKDNGKGKGKELASIAQQEEMEIETEMAVEEVRKEISQVQVDSDRGIPTPTSATFPPAVGMAPTTLISTPEMFQLDDVGDALGEISRSQGQGHEMVDNGLSASHTGRMPQERGPDSRGQSAEADDESDDVIASSLSRMAKGKQRAVIVLSDSEDEVGRTVVEETSSGEEAPGSENEDGTSASGDEDNDMDLDNPTPRRPRRSLRQRRYVEPFRMPSVHSEDSSIGPSEGPSDIFKIHDSEIDDALVARRISSPPSSDEEPENIAGLPVITWKSLVSSRRLLPPEYRRNCDLDTSLKEQMLKTTVDFQRGDAGREIFEAVMNAAPSGFSSNGARAHDVPPIEVFDNDIGTESTPPWEFVYTNEMWHGEGVPAPDRRNMLSCGCVGKCDPRDTACACAKRQWAFTKKLGGVTDEMRWPGAPFLYDNKGLLHIQEYPIFECNEFCGCDDDCPNRVVQSGRKHIVNIVRTENKGWGVFAGPRRIPKGAFIGIYAGELLTSAECEERGTIYDENGRTYLFDVDFWYIDRSEHDYTVDAFHAGNFTRFMNHSCDPNCNITPCYINEGNLQKPLLVLFTNREVEAYEELCFSYLGDIEEYKKDHAEELDEPGNPFQQCYCGAGEGICVKKIFK